MRQKSFSFIEVLIFLGIIAIVAAIIIVVVNPARSLVQARDSQRWSDVNAILNAVHQRIVDHEGVFAEGTICDPLPSAEKTISGLDEEDKVDLCNCLVPDYLPTMPHDPSLEERTYGDCLDYDTGYTIIRNEAGKINVAAPKAELDNIIVTR